MNSGRYVLSQVLDLVHRQTLDRLVSHYNAQSRARNFGCRQQLICMAFAQLTRREGLRDIATCLNAKPEALYHMGFLEPVAKSTLADANEQRDWSGGAGWEDVAKTLMGKARALYAGEDLGLELENTVYALDSTTVDLSLTLFPWADFRKTKAGIKMHTQVDLRGPIPTCIYITSARKHDVVWARRPVLRAGSLLRDGPWLHGLPEVASDRLCRCVLRYASQGQPALFQATISSGGLKLPGTLHRTLQLLSVHPFEKVPLPELLAETDSNSLTALDCNHLILFDL